MGEPVFLALLTADRIITENNNKKGIIGTFNRLASPRFPVRFPLWWIYASATNISGDHSFELSVVSDVTEKSIFKAKGNLQIESTGQIVEISIPVPACGFPEPGLYSVLFDVDGSQLGARVLRVDQIEATADG